MSIPSPKVVLDRHSPEISRKIFLFQEMKRPVKRARLDGSETSKEVGDLAQVSNLEEYRIEDMPDCEVYYVPSFISKEVSEDWYSKLVDLDSWYQPKLKMYGREITQSRKIAAYATDPNLALKYSGQTVDMKYEYPPVLRDIQDQVEKKLEVKFNHVMLNLYEDGKVYIGNHRDNIENKVIASVSLGAPRTFNMTHDRTKKKKSKTTPSNTSDTPRQEEVHNNKRRSDDDDVEADNSTYTASVNQKSWILDPGSLVVMQGETQKFWKHEIPKEPKVTKGRISLTFRQLSSS